jgi:hypothetical protein
MFGMKDKNILIVSCVFPPEPVVSANLSFDIAGELAFKNNVTVISPLPTRPYGSNYRNNIIQNYISKPEINLKIISANQGSQNPPTNESYSLNMYKVPYSVQVNLYKKILFYPSFNHCN